MITYASELLDLSQVLLDHGRMVVGEEAVELCQYQDEQREYNIGQRQMDVLGML